MTAYVVPTMTMASQGGHQLKAFVSALGLEILLLGAGLFWLATHPPQPAVVVIPLTIDAAPTEVREKLSEPEVAKLPPPPPLSASPKTSPVLKPSSHLMPPPVFQTTPAAVSPIPMPAPVPNPVPDPGHASASAAFVAPIAAPPPALAPAVDPSPAYNAKLAAAVQAVFEVPAAAAELNFRGRTRVEFSLRDGVVSMVRIVQTSGLGVADRAAVKAVQAARYPAPPLPLQGKEGTYQIWVACL